MDWASGKFVPTVSSVATRPSIRRRIGNAIMHIAHWVSMDKGEYATNQIVYADLPIGVAPGLNRTDGSNAGTIIYVEAITLRKGHGNLDIVTAGGGSLDNMAYDVARIAHSFSLNFLREKGNSTLEKYHLRANIVTRTGHGVAGPSAGITMCTAFVSLALNKRIKPGVCMTGEITLNGKVLSVGGVKQQIRAAKQWNFTYIILPKENISRDLNEEDKAGIKIIGVESYEEVFDFVFV